MFMLAPLGYAIYTSLYTTRIIGGTVFTGAANYTQTLQSGEFWSGVIRVIIFAAIQIPVMLAIAFFFATVFDLGVAKYGDPVPDHLLHPVRGARRGGRGHVVVPAGAAVRPVRAPRQRARLP